MAAITQVELYCSGEYKVYWLTHENNAICGPDGFSSDEMELRQGLRLIVQEEPERKWTVVRVFVSLPSDCPLPVKSRKGTIECLLLDEDGSEDVKAAYPRMYVGTQL